MQTSPLTGKPTLRFDTRDSYTLLPHRHLAALSQPPPLATLIPSIGTNKDGDFHQKIVIREKDGSLIQRHQFLERTIPTCLYSSGGISYVQRLLEHV